MEVSQLFEEVDGYLKIWSLKFEIRQFQTELYRALTKVKAGKSSKQVSGGVLHTEAVIGFSKINWKRQKKVTEVSQLNSC